MVLKNKQYLDGDFLEIIGNHWRIQYLMRTSKYRLNQAILFIEWK